MVVLPSAIHISAAMIIQLVLRRLHLLVNDMPSPATAAPEQYPAAAPASAPRITIATDAAATIASAAHDVKDFIDSNETLNDLERVHSVQLESSKLLK